jgi:hypothetical protein
MFATPVCVHFLPVAQDMNPELRGVVLERMNGNGTNGHHGQGWRSADDFADWGGMHAQTLFRVLRELGDTLTATRGGGRISLEWTISAAASVRQKGDYLEMMPRPGAVWSGVYFADDGYAKSDDETLGGEIKLADPRGALPAMVAPNLAFRIPGGGTAGQVQLIRPQSGMILLHPSWQPCGERLLEGPGPRVTIEFDLGVPPTA